MQGVCKICNNPAIEGSQFCKPHHRAHVRLESAFGKWQLAYSNELSKRAFLEGVLQLLETGQKAREVTRFLLEDLP